MTESRAVGWAILVSLGLHAGAAVTLHHLGLGPGGDELPRLYVDLVVEPIVARPGPARPIAPEPGRRRVREPSRPVLASAPPSPVVPMPPAAVSEDAPSSEPAVPPPPAPSPPVVGGPSPPVGPLPIPTVAGRETPPAAPVPETRLEAPPGPPPAAGTSPAPGVSWTQADAPRREAPGAPDAVPGGPAREADPQASQPPSRLRVEPGSPGRGRAPTGVLAIGPPGHADAGPDAGSAPGQPAHESGRQGGGAGGASGEQLALALGRGRAIPPEYEGYVRELRRRVQERLVYPWLAVRRGLTGTVELEIELDAAGRVVALAAVGPEAPRLLRDAALKAVRDAAPFPLPPGVAPRALAVRLPVVFELR